MSPKPESKRFLKWDRWSFGVCLFLSISFKIFSLNCTGMGVRTFVYAFQEQNKNVQRNIYINFKYLQKIYSKKCVKIYRFLNVKWHF